MLVQKYRVNDIFRADAHDLCKYVEPNSVALTVTSPPYRNAIDYSQHISNMKNGGRAWIRGTGEQTTAAYLDSMQKIFDGVLAATMDGGFCCIVVGDEVVNGKLIPLPSLLLSRLASLENDDDPRRWRFRDMIVWHKVTSGRNGAGNRFGLLVQHPWPGYFRANIMHENILILQKGTRRSDITRDSDGRIPINRIVKREWANSVWNIPPVPPNVTNHPVPFPEQIPWRLITLLTQKGDVVMDPMNGSGQTTKAAYNMGRKYIGIDVKREYVLEARRRLKQKMNVGGHLIPVYHKESWTPSTQNGYFETEIVDMSRNIPNGYTFAFQTEADKPVGGKKGVYVYYKNPNDNYLCFILSVGGKCSRLNLGSLALEDTMLHSVMARLPASFYKAGLNNMLPSRIVENRQPIKACLDVLIDLGYVEYDKKNGQRQYFCVTADGKDEQERLASGR